MHPLAFHLGLVPSVLLIGGAGGPHMAPDGFPSRTGDVSIRMVAREGLRAITRFERIDVEVRNCGEAPILLPPRFVWLKVVLYSPAQDRYFQYSSGGVGCGSAPHSGALLLPGTSTVTPIFLTPNLGGRRSSVAVGDQLRVHVELRVDPDDVLWKWSPSPRGPSVPGSQGYTPPSKQVAHAGYHLRAMAKPLTYDWPVVERRFPALYWREAPADQSALEWRSIPGDADGEAGPHLWYGGDPDIFRDWVRKRTDDRFGLE